VMNNPIIRAGLNLRTVAWAFTTTYHDYWHPIPWVTHIIDYQLYGLVAGGHHLTSLLFHLAAVLTLFWWLFLATSRLWPSALVAALFAVHPVHVESVAWIAERKDVTCALFWNLTLLAYVRYAIRQRRALLWIALLFYALALMSKPMAMTLPFVLVLLDWWPLGRFSTMPRKAALLLEKLPFFALAAASIVYTYTTYDTHGNLTRRIPLLGRAAYASVAYLLYLGKLFWPSRLAVLYPLPPQPPTVLAGAAAAVCIAGLSVLALYAARRIPEVVGWLWFIGVLVPVCGIIHTGHQLYADRFLYLPATGLYILVVWLLLRLELLRSRWIRPVIAAFSASLLVALTLLTSQQVGRWRDSAELFRHTVSTTRNNVVALRNLGADLLLRGHPSEAAGFFRAAGLLAPDDAQLYNNYGLCMFRLRRYDQALAFFAEANRLRPHHFETLLCIARTRQHSGDNPAAVLYADSAASVIPPNSGAYTAIGGFWLELEEPGKARNALMLADSLGSTAWEPYRDLGDLQLSAGLPAEAAEAYYKAAVRAPRSAELFVTAGIAFYQVERYDDALECFARALSIDANDSIAARYRNRICGQADTSHGRQQACESGQKP